MGVSRPLQSSMKVYCDPVLQICHLEDHSEMIQQITQLNLSQRQVKAIVERGP